MATTAPLVRRQVAPPNLVGGPARLRVVNRPRRHAGALWALAALATLGSACSAAENGSVTTTPALATESPEAACTRQVSYWVGELLRQSPDQGFDYQHMGLSGRTYDVVRSVTAAARAAGRTDPTWVAEQAGSACRAAVAREPSATSTSGGWP